MNATVAGISYRAVLGRRRIWLLLLLPLALIAMALLMRLTGRGNEATAVELMQGLAISAMLPLVGAIVGTGVIGPEIDDGTILHLLSKPIPRPVIVFTKFVVAASLLVLFGAVSTFLAAYIVVGSEAGIAAGFALGAAAGGIAYAAVFLLLGIVTKHAVTVGIVYAIVWEGLVGGLVPGARQLSIQQWAQSIAGQVSTSSFFTVDVGLGFALPALVVVTVLAVVLAGRRLRVFSLTGEA